METSIKDNLKAKDTWVRGLYMLLFALFYSIAEIVLAVVVLVQFGFRLFSGRTNPNLLNFGQSLSTYFYQIIQFLTFNSEEKPYPFHDWPKGAPESLQPAEALPEGPAESEPGKIPPADYDEPEKA